MLGRRLKRAWRFGDVSVDANGVTRLAVNEHVVVTLYAVDGSVETHLEMWPSREHVLSFQVLKG